MVRWARVVRRLLQPVSQAYNTCADLVQPMLLPRVDSYAGYRLG